jgi:hypothetical protein
MTPAIETIVVHFAYRAEPKFAFALLTDGQSTPSSLAEVLPFHLLTYAAAMPDALSHDTTAQDRSGALLMLAREEAAYRPKIRPVRHVGRASDQTRRKPRSRAMTDGCTDSLTVRPAHPTHLLIVSARRVRPARLSASQPVAAAIAATRTALYPAVPTTSAPQLGLRTAAHLVAVAGLFMSVAETAVAQQMLALF